MVASLDPVKFFLDRIASAGLDTFGTDQRVADAAAPPEVFEMRARLDLHDTLTMPTGERLKVSLAVRTSNGQKASRPAH